MNFEIITDLTLLPKVEANFEMLNAEFDVQLEKYKGIVLTEETVQVGKGYRADLNNLAKAIDEERKRVKKEWNKPFEDFEQKAKLLITKITEVSNLLDVQVKSFENAEKEEKRKAIEHFYRTNASELIDLVPLTKIWNDKWLNKTYTATQYSKDITDTLNRARNDIGIIKAMKLSCEDIVMSAYLDSLDMSKALEAKTKFEARQEALAKASKATAVTIEPVIEPIITQAPPTIVHKTFVNEEATKTIKVVFYDTTQEFRAEMKALTEKHNIKYGGVE